VRSSGATIILQPVARSERPSKRGGVPVVGDSAVFITGEQLASAWALFLSRFTWQWFCTFTFREAPHPEAADKVFRVFTNELNRSIDGKRWASKPDAGVYWVRALEWQKREVLHYHALMSHVCDLNAGARRLSWMDRWNELAGFAKIERPIGTAAVSNYVSKYVAKGGEIDLSANLRSYAEQISAVPTTR
jgi:hypothetical protein